MRIAPESQVQHTSARRAKRPAVSGKHLSSADTSALQIDSLARTALDAVYENSGYHWSNRDIRSAFIDAACTQSDPVLTKTSNFEPALRMRGAAAAREHVATAQSAKMAAGRQLGIEMFRGSVWLALAHIAERLAPPIPHRLVPRLDRECSAPSYDTHAADTAAAIGHGAAKVASAIQIGRAVVPLTDAVRAFQSEHRYARLAKALGELPLPV